eukprot:CAMPEP_0172944362 /NCGR_PEP_ID=MMETSP1075-20121228/226009_1 /TAXON_ID=2916 /ORGANISM="Ceratium fusus, Strain PA161109" /LENGTH=59 /DNA_ID=CAMNT_0013805789 /DNA_START=1141 /DNA_END=1320 /DNA_ORIENTATION=-
MAAGRDSQQAAAWCLKAVVGVRKQPHWAHDPYRYQKLCGQRQVNGALPQFNLSPVCGIA